MAGSVEPSTDPIHGRWFESGPFSVWLALEVSEYNAPWPIPPPGNLRRSNAMKVTRILAALTLVVGFAGVAHAQGCARLTWGPGSCDPWVENKAFAGPGQYTLVLSMFGVSAPNVGTDNQVRVRHL